jgi:ATP-dependent 26S proteasome regulatory subunit
MFTDHVKVTIRSRGGNIWVRTRDEFRAEALIVAAVSKLGYRVKVWRASLGLFDYTPDASKLPIPDPRNATLNPVGACQQLFQYSGNEGPLVVIFEDVAEFLKNPQTLRWFKDLGLKSKSAPKASHVQVICVDSEQTRDGFIGIDLDLPSREELTAIVKGTLASAGLDVNGINVDDVVDVITGLEAVQAQRALAQCLAEKKAVDLRTIMRAKKELIKGTAAITWIEPPEGGLAVVGGLDVAKRYVQRAEKPFRNARLDPKVRKPKGFIASGVPGTGKTYLSHCVGAAWGLPVLNFDISAAMGGIVGETEKNVERALDIAKACAPCILCLDELEKGLAGSGGDGRTDGGVMNRVIDRLLKFLNDTKESVFVVVTMNDPMKLQGNPELFRRGRFDKIFWVDVPNKADRLAVLQIHAKAKSVEGVDLEAVAAVTRNFTGAELEAILDEATWAAQSEEREVTTADCLEAAKGIVPIVDMWGDKGSLGEAREWAKRGAVLANDPEETDNEMAVPAYVQQIDMDEGEESGVN